MPLSLALRIAIVAVAPDTVAAPAPTDDATPAAAISEPAAAEGEGAPVDSDASLAEAAASPELPSSAGDPGSAASTAASPVPTPTGDAAVAADVPAAPVAATPTPAATPAVASAEPVLQPTILAEVDYRAYPELAEGATGFALARLRPGLSLSPVAWFRGVVVMEFAAPTPFVLDAVARFRAAEWVDVSVGYVKPPMFASFIYEPVHVLPFPDRAPVVNAFRLRRDLGVDVRFSPRRAPVEGWLRVGNGTGSPFENDNALPAVYGLLDLVLGRAWVGSSPERRTLGLRLGGSGYIESPRARDALGGRTPLGFDHFTPPVVVSGLRIVGSGHLVGYAGPVRLTVEAAGSLESGDVDDDGDPDTPSVALPGPLTSYGMTSEVAWVVHGSAREVGRAPGAARSSDGGWAGGAVELAARYDGMWLSHGSDLVTSGGSQGGALAIKWWPVDSCRVSEDRHRTGAAGAWPRAVTGHEGAYINSAVTLSSASLASAVSMRRSTPSRGE